MSVQFYEDMAKIQKYAYEIQMLEGSHPYAVEDSHKQEIAKMAESLEKIEENMKKELKQRFGSAKPLATKKKKKGS